jgi:hypothetical protein
MGFYSLEQIAMIDASRHTNTRTLPAPIKRDRYYAEASGGQDIYMCVSVCVVL